jgi:branched-chain amino acid transport system ATP-binding protein
VTDATDGAATESAATDGAATDGAATDGAATESAATESAATAAVGSDDSAPLLAAVDIVAGYVPEVNILNGTNLELFAGELIGVIGPNGAGKSTLVKALFGLIPVREGTVMYEGRDVTGMKAHKLVSMGIGYVPQTENVFPQLTVAENLEMGVYLRPKDFGERFEVVTTMFPRLAERRAQRAGSLSGGERQMLSLGRAVMMDPKVLLLDEPSAGLSPAYQDEVFINCRRINDAGVSIVMVEQNANRCLQICHRGYVLDQGRNAYTDEGDALLNDPKVIELYLGTLARVD